jgi:hypothetical protein
MDNKIFILIIVIFLLTTPITSVSWNILKYLFYLLLFITAISLVSTDISNKIKEYLVKIINMDGSLILNILSLIFSKIKNFFFPSNQSSAPNQSLAPNQSVPPNESLAPNQSSQPRPVEKASIKRTSKSMRLV